MRSCRLRAHRSEHDRAAISRRAPTTATASNAGPELRLRQEQAAVVEEDAAGNRDAVAHLRQRLEHGVVPEQQLQQQRHVADRLDVAGGELAPRSQFFDSRAMPIDEAEDGREHDAEAGDQQRVEQADPEGAAIGRGLRRIGDQRLADVEAGGLVPEAEAGGDVGALRDCRRRCWRRHRRERRSARTARPDRRCCGPCGSLENAARAGAAGRSIDIQPSRPSRGAVARAP